MVLPLLVLQLDPADPVGRLADWLVDAGLELDLQDISAGAPVPSSLAGHSGLIVLGGLMSANDTHLPFIAEIRALLRTAVAEEVPTLGVCLGAQLLAAANGGQVQRNPAGPEVGAQLIAKRSSAADDPLFGPLPITPDVIQWHYDAITTLPAGAVQLASSPGAEQQAFRLGRLAWGIQFHIETTPAVVENWAAEDAAELADYDLERIVARAVAIHDDLPEVWAPFAAAFADVVRDPAAVVFAQPAATVQDALAGLHADLNASRAPMPAPLPMPGLRPPEHG
ncbi:type 1 glutamine amidotransferase [Jatrophihabitans sp.]|uniref:type 1 glutamine amidotransferase n=1 Tax=Jatrophihabitans sp. TaxID=1932789 RepID=UPI0030C76F5E|nr:glutamine amidotransferase class-I [Jatrophihabitans sp.]